MSATFDDEELPPMPTETIIPEEGIEFFECQKCGEWNILKNVPKKRRTTRVRHMRIDDVAYASLKRFATINNVNLNYAIQLLLMNSRTGNINYLVNERHLVSKDDKKNNSNTRSKKKGHN